MAKKSGLLALVLAVLALGLSIFNFVSAPKAQQQEEADVQYVIYLGTNDKDSYEPYGTPEAVKAKVDEVLTKQFRGLHHPGGQRRLDE